MSNYKEWRFRVVELLGGDYYDERDYGEWFALGYSPQYVRDFYEQQQREDKGNA